MKRLTITAVLAVACAGGGLAGGYFWGRHAGQEQGYARGYERGKALSERPVLMPLLMESHVASEELLAGLGWSAEQMDGVDLERWATALNQVPFPVHKKDEAPRTLADAVTAVEDCPLCRTQSEFARDLVAAGLDLNEVRKRLYTDVRAAFDTEGATVLGATSPAVQVVWWVDFQCPHCARSVELVDELLQRYPDQLQVVVMNLPLRMHPEADEAARAAYAADRQGRFWEMADLLFEQRKHLDREVPSEGGVAMEGLAERIGLDMDRYRDDYLSEETTALMERQQGQARSWGVRGVPSFYIAGHKPTVKRSAESYARYIDEVLAGRHPAVSP